jgi:hypothetical protein
MPSGGEAGAAITVRDVTKPRYWFRSNDAPNAPIILLRLLQRIAGASI